MYVLIFLSNKTSTGESVQKGVSCLSSVICYLKDPEKHNKSNPFSVGYIFLICLSPEFKFLNLYIIVCTKFSVSFMEDCAIDLW